MRVLPVLIAMLVLAGCSTREPLARTAITVELDKATYKTLVERAGSSSVGVGAGAGASFGSGGSRSVGVGIGISFQLTNEVRLVGADAANLDRSSFDLGLRWGANTLDAPLYHPHVIVLLVGSGPSGRISRQVGELRTTGLAAGGYQLKITDADAAMTLVPR